MKDTTMKFSSIHFTYYIVQDFKQNIIFGFKFINVKKNILFM